MPHMTKWYNQWTCIFDIPVMNKSRPLRCCRYGYCAVPWYQLRYSECLLYKYFHRNEWCCVTWRKRLRPISPWNQAWTRKWNTRSAAGCRARGAPVTFCFRLRNHKPHALCASYLNPRMLVWDGMIIIFQNCSYPFCFVSRNLFLIYVCNFWLPREQ